jgi:hypothetical protein
VVQFGNIIADTGKDVRKRSCVNFVMPSSRHVCACLCVSVTKRGYFNPQQQQKKSQRQINTQKNKERVSE